MTAATIQRPTRAELRLGAILLALTAAAWVLSADRMAGMDTTPGAQLGGIDWFALTWFGDDGRNDASGARADGDGARTGPGSRLHPGTCPA